MTTADRTVRLAYGKTGLEISLPENLDVTIIEPKYVPGLPAPSSALRSALRDPAGSKSLAELAVRRGKVGIVFSDITRPTPNSFLLPVILSELDGLARENIILFNALGTHRPNSEAELRVMLGDKLVDDYHIIQNDAFDLSTQVSLGVSSLGHEIWLNRELIDCDLHILTGFIEPHLFAGFSGGCKAILPGMAGQRTVLENHGAGMIANPSATWGVTHGNPIWEEIHEVVARVGSNFLVNVTLNKDKEITAFFAGDPDKAYEAGCEFVRSTAMQPVDQPYDIVVTTNSGYPLDLNLYQAVKGMSAASQIVREGGAIIIAAECLDGIPEHGLYRQLLRQAGNPRTLLDMLQSPGFLKQDQWQAQIQAQIQLKAEVYVYSDYLTDDQITQSWFRPCRSVEGILNELVGCYGSRARICILPEGPQTIPYLEVKPEQSIKRG